MIENGGRYASLLLGAAALLWLADHGIEAARNPIHEEQYVVRDTAMNQDAWNQFLIREDVKFLCAFVFVTSGSSVTLPSDFNTANNTIHCIGNGAPGQGGGQGASGTCGGSGSGC